MRRVCIMTVVCYLVCAAWAAEETGASAGTSSTSISVAPQRLRDYDIPGLDERVNLNAFDAWDVVQLIQFLAHRGGIKNIVIGKGVQGLTTRLKFDDVSVGDALEVVLTVNSLAYVIQGGIITIMTDAEYRALYGRGFYDHKQVSMESLTYADAVRVATMLGPIKSTIGTVVSDPVTGTLILIDTPEKIAEMREIVRKADIPTLSRLLPTETREFRLQYAEVATVQGELASILSQETGSMHSDARTRTISVTDLPHKMREVERVVSLFDQRPRQVFIEAKIVQVSLTDDFRLGVNWNHVFQGLDPRFSIRSAASPTPLATIGGDTRSPSGSLTYNTIAAGGDLTMVLEALKSVGETKVLSNPHVAVIDGEEASIKVITDQPYAEAQLESGSTNVVGESITFIEVGVTLTVTPRINDDNLISMGIRPEVSAVIGNYEAFRSVPIVRRSIADTSVMIKDAETIIIAGMIDNTKKDVESRIPLLGRIPLIGVLFRTERQEVDSNELVVFLTPRIITGEQAFLRMNDMKKRPKPLRAVGPDSGKKLKPLR